MTVIQKTLIILCFIFSLSVSAQSEIQIELRDIETSQPISFATIRFKGSERGLIADYNGQFRLPYKSINDLPFLKITSLGYLALEVDPKLLNTSEINILNMAPQAEALDEVIINVSKGSRASAERLSSLVKSGQSMLSTDIVRKAVYAIPFNLNANAHAYVGYYRDYQIVESKYYNLNEGIIEQYDNGIRSHKLNDSLNQSVVYSFVKNTTFQVNDQYTNAYNGRTKFIERATINPYGGNELTLLNVHDAIRNYDIKAYSFVYRMIHDFVYQHSFVKGEINFINDEPIIDIELKSLSEKVGYSHKAIGTIKISLKDYSIHSFSYTVYDYNKFNPLFNIETEYRRQGGKMYLNYITFNNRFVIADKNVFKESSVVYDKQKNSFNISFNTNLSPKTIQKRDFKIRYKGKKIFIKKLKITGPNSISLFIAEFDEELKFINSENIKDLEFNIRNISDANNRQIYEPTKKIAYQFREYFIQEVFQDKKLTKKLKYLSKVKSLKEAPVNRNIDMDSYIINTPLMDRRMKSSTN